jgi:hypothetical protein
MEKPRRLTNKILERDYFLKETFMKTFTLTITEDDNGRISVHNPKTSINYNIIITHLFMSLIRHSLEYLQTAKTDKEESPCDLTT